MSESRPGVTSAVLTPAQALTYLDAAMLRAPHLRVVGIAGPGDPFAAPETTLETLRLVRDKYPEMLLCVASNGLNIEPYVSELAALEVSHVTLTINAVDPVVAEHIYSWVRDGRAIYRGETAARLLVERQLSAAAALKAAGITLKINTILVPGINEHHVEAVAERMRDIGADIMNCIPLYPVEDTPFFGKEELSTEAIQLVRARVSAYVPQMEHCTRCRADAVGLLGEQQSPELMDIMQACADGRKTDRSGKPYVAVASMEGILVNQHLGEAMRLWVFEQADEEPRFVELRNTPPAGGGNGRWRELAETLGDCHTLLVSGVGRAPRWVLEQAGLRVVEMQGLIAQAMESLHATGDIPPSLKKQFRGCGSGCEGTGAGCA
jgi:nitrogen fixation protein NifB